MNYTELNEQELSSVISKSRALLVEIPQKLRQHEEKQKLADLELNLAAERVALYGGLGPGHEAAAFAASKDAAAAQKAKQAHRRAIDEARAAEAQQRQILTRATAELTRKREARARKLKDAVDRLLRDQHATKREAAIEALAQWFTADCTALGVAVTHADLSKTIAIRLNGEANLVIERALAYRQELELEFEQNGDKV